MNNESNNQQTINNGEQNQFQNNNNFVQGDMKPKKKTNIVLIIIICTLAVLGVPVLIVLLIFVPINTSFINDSKMSSSIMDTEIVLKEITKLDIMATTTGDGVILEKNNYANDETSKRPGNSTLKKNLSTNNYSDIGLYGENDYNLEISYAWKNSDDSICVYLAANKGTSLYDVLKKSIGNDYYSEIVGNNKVGYGIIACN